MGSVKFESNEEKSEEFEEMDLSCRYGRYKHVLGHGAIKTVYQGVDYREGIEVAWNKVSLRCLNDYCIQRLYSKVSLLASLAHENILFFYDAWLNKNNKSINFITEFCPSGTLRQYRHKHKHVSIHAIKKMAWQILKGLNYLHSCNPPIIHKDLNCSNIFVEGNSGIVKIGDLGLSCVVGQDGFAHMQENTSPTVSTCDGLQRALATTLTLLEEFENMLAALMRLGIPTMAASRFF